MVPDGRSIPFVRAAVILDGNGSTVATVEY